MNVKYTYYDGSILQKTYSVTIVAKVTVTTFSYSSTSIDVGKTSSSPTASITGTAKSGPTYSSSNTSIATVNSSGVVTGVSVGTATITIRYTNYDGSTSTKTCTVTIKTILPTVSSFGSADNEPSKFSYIKSYRGSSSSKNHTLTKTSGIDVNGGSGGYFTTDIEIIDFLQLESTANEGSPNIAVSTTPNTYYVSRSYWWHWNLETNM